ncbi:MAG TPA: hypothetical protein VMS17_29210 [Gemmataceae bacterium]|nr:hypothetical protein [Gemmataceae bacterium]
MAARKAEETNPHVAGDREPDGASKARAADPPPNNHEQTLNGASAGAGAPPAPATQAASRGLDDVPHAQSQRIAAQADFLHKGLFPALIAAALRLDGSINTKSYCLYLDQMLEACGSPTDPIERMMVEQLCLLHFRIGQVHGGAAEASNSEIERQYNGMAARLLSEFRQTALALRHYRSRTPDAKPGERVAALKAAQ